MKPYTKIFRDKACNIQHFLTIWIQIKCAVTTAKGCLVKKEWN
jgi:hypothetical protein